MNFAWGSTSLSIEQNESIMFNSEISGVIQTSDLFIILIYPIIQTGSPLNTDLVKHQEGRYERLPINNIYAYNHQSKLVWQIEPPPQTDVKISYEYMLELPSGEIFVQSMLGDRFIVNQENGEITPFTGELSADIEEILMPKPL